MYHKCSLISVCHAYFLDTINSMNLLDLHNLFTHLRYVKLSCWLEYKNPYTRLKHLVICHINANCDDNSKYRIENSQVRMVVDERWKHHQNVALNKLKPCLNELWLLFAFTVVQSNWFSFIIVNSFSFYWNAFGCCSLDVVVLFLIDCVWLAIIIFEFGVKLFNNLFHWISYLTRCFSFDLCLATVTREDGRTIWDVLSYAIAGGGCPLFWFAFLTHIFLCSHFFVMEVFCCAIQNSARQTYERWKHHQLSFEMNVLWMLVLSDTSTNESGCTHDSESNTCQSSKALTATCKGFLVRFRWFLSYLYSDHRQDVVGGLIEQIQGSSKNWYRATQWSTNYYSKHKYAPDWNMNGHFQIPWAFCHHLSILLPFFRLCLCQLLAILFLHNSSTLLHQTHVLLLSHYSVLVILCLSLRRQKIIVTWVWRRIITKSLVSWSFVVSFVLKAYAFVV